MRYSIFVSIAVIRKVIPDSAKEATIVIEINNKVIIVGLVHFPLSWDKAFFFCSDIEIIRILLSKNFI